MLLLSVVLIFLAVFLGVLAVIYYVRSAREASATKRRLFNITRGARLEEAAVAEELLRETTRAEQILYSLPLMKRLKKLVEHSGVAITPPRFLACCAAGALLVFVTTLAVRNAIAAAAAALFTFLLPLFFLSYKKKERQQKFTEQLPDALSIVARSLRAGHSLASAVELVSYELTDPISSLFKLAYDQQKLGVRMADSLLTLQQKIESMDFNFFVTIVRINTDTGGNLAEILEKLGETVRIRMQIRRQVDVFTAEGRLSGYVLVALPVVVFYLFYLMHPEYISVFFTERICQLWLVGAVLAQLVGYLFIRKIINIRI